MNITVNKTINYKRLLVCVGMLLIAGVSFATGSLNLGSMASSITSTFTPLTKLITGGCYVAGLTMILMALLKFKAHKDNPTQEPLSKGMVLLSVGAALVFLPSAITSAGSTIFGSGASSGSPTGSVYSK